MKLRQHLLLCLSSVSVLCAAPLLAADKPQFGEWGVDLSEMSKTVRPGDDFFRYVNEGWLNREKIPAGMPEYNDALRIYLSNEQRFNAIIQDVLAKPQKAGSPEQQIADTYRSHINMAKRNALGLTPLKADMAKIAKARTHKDLARVLADPWMTGPFGAGVLSDSGDPQRYVTAVGQDGLTLPQDYYLNEGEPYSTVRGYLKTYIGDTLKRAGIADADAKAARIFELEMVIARLHWTTPQRRDVVAMYRPMTPAELKAFAPGFDWDLYLKAQGYGGIQKINVITSTAVQGLSKLFGQTPVDLWKDYMTFHLLSSFSDKLGEEWQKAHFEFFESKLQGIRQQRPLEIRAVASTNASMGPQIGKLYVQRHFPAEHRAQVRSMVDYIQQTFADRISKLDWMDAPTKKEAQAKLAKVAIHIGYPDKWQDYSSVVIKPDDLVGNDKRMMQWARADSLRKLKETRRDWEWPYSPQEVNAGYVTTLNSITFPAGILQPPYFDPNAEAAANFGAIAAVIGHEFGHGFDDQGSRSDGDGRLRDWWTAASRAEFEKRTAGLVEQYNGYEVVPGAFINGRQNLGENIGDLGGISIAIDAYRRYVKDKQGGQAPVIGGLTGDQRFFLSWGQVWRGLVTPEKARKDVLTDNHSANHFRVNGVVRNVDEWYKAFNIGPNDKLYIPPEKRVRIW